MKSILLTFSLILAFACPSYSQQEDTVQRTEEYCLILATAKFLSPKVNISVDFGQEQKFWSDKRMKDTETGEVVNFNSVVDALNYMNSLGWEFVNAYVITVSNQNVYHYLMRRKMKE